MNRSIRLAKLERKLTPKLKYMSFSMMYATDAEHEEWDKLNNPNFTIEQINKDVRSFEDMY
jgi:hypothetical protein